MAILPVILGMGQRCPKCNQRSSPKVGQGKWETLGVWNGAIHKCTKCETLIRVGFMSDQALTEDEKQIFLESRAASL